MTKESVIADDGVCPPSHTLPFIVLCCGGFSDQIKADARSMPIRAIVKASFDLGFRAFDASPYYGPSEELLGDALS
ncbi:hypothetical protein CNMCM7691_006849 [Aspergillus felis]|uniref:NADP-dependent oxidoreductase domain-containing protein n=1 Tax=Aspergillus felis TaxID=1287682 RepID=A0A8H6QUI3_9EURO|nr:hypothetical protein CNMCM7691_006849 [Aspergillus felis]